MAEAKKYWDSEEIIGEVTLSGGKQKRVVSAVTKGDDSFVSVSTWKFFKPKGENAEKWVPTGGITIPTGTAEGQQVFDLIATMFAAPQEPKKSTRKKAGAAK